MQHVFLVFRVQFIIIWLLHVIYLAFAQLQAILAIMSSKQGKIVCSPQSLWKVPHIYYTSASTSTKFHEQSNCLYPAHRAHQTAVLSRQKTVPHNRTNELYQVKGGVKGGGVFPYQY